jgi:hypothetical protein
MQSMSRADDDAERSDEEEWCAASYVEGPRR